MENLPLYVYFIFGLTVVFAAWMFVRATYYSKKALTIVAIWIALQSVLGITGFYNDPATMTTRFPLLFLPPLLFIIYRLSIQKGRSFIDQLDMPTLTLIHLIRIPVELVLFWLFVRKTVPEAMTFHGRNFDIFSGITAPVIYYLAFVKKTISRKIVLAWNLVCLILLINVVSSAVLSLPARFQQFGFERPNLGLGYFPFMLLPAFLVPVVLLAMIAGIRWGMKKDQSLLATGCTDLHREKTV